MKGIEPRERVKKMKFRRKTKDGKKKTVDMKQDRGDWKVLETKDEGIDVTEQERSRRQCDARTKDGKILV